MEPGNEAREEVTAGRQWLKGLVAGVGAWRQLAVESIPQGEANSDNLDDKKN